VCAFFECKSPPQAKLGTLNWGFWPQKTGETSNWGRPAPKTGETNWGRKVAKTGEIPSSHLYYSSVRALPSFSSAVQQPHGDD
jgi:hypothetical protein